MPFEGKQLQPSQLAKMLWDEGFRDFTLVEMVATCLAESQGYTHATNENLDERGRVKSKDIGLFQINIPISKIGTHYERSLYDPRTNIKAAKKLFNTRMTLRKKRRFQPWYAFTLGWATFPRWWVYTKKTKPRRWDPTGRYIHRAIIGVANFYAIQYGIDYPYPFVSLPTEPPKPTKPPIGDGIRPKENSGRGTAI